MIKLVKSNGITDEYVCDKVEELQTLSKAPQGSTVFCINNKQVYMKNGYGDWVQL